MVPRGLKASALNPRQDNVLARSEVNVFYRGSEKQLGSSILVVGVVCNIMCRRTKGDNAVHCVMSISEMTHFRNIETSRKLKW